MDIKINIETANISPKTEHTFLNVLNKEKKTSSPNRDIEVEFLDVSNEEKYDRLLKDDKIKNPFKRRLSCDSRSNSPLPIETDQKNVDKVSSKKSKLEDRLGPKNRTSSCSSGSAKFYNSKNFELNEEILSRRQKQIDYGKNTLGYDNYTQSVPR